MTLRDLASRARDDAREWAQGRSWAWRLPVLLYLAYVGVRHLANPEYATIFGGITFGIHELGHVLFGWAGEFIGIAGGSIAQLLAPIAATLVLLRQRDWFGVSVTTCWLAFSLFNLATYVGDARDQYLPLVGLSDEPEHDWAYLLGAVHLLEADHALAFLVRVVAFATWAAAVAFGSWLLWRMAKAKP